MKKILSVFKKELMLSVSLIAAVAALFITPPSKELITAVDWRTLGVLFMMLTVLEGFKKENLFLPLLRIAGKFKTMTALSFFLVFCVFFSSMFVTNDVSLIIFVPITIMMFRAAAHEEFILPVITFENIAAVRGSLLTPFGSPQNIFVFGQSGVSAFGFVKWMMPLWIMSAVLLCVFILFLYRKNLSLSSVQQNDISLGIWSKKNKKQRIMYFILFAIVIFVIVSRTAYWYVALAAVLISVLTFDRKILLKTDYVLLLTFLCFFVFSSSICSNPSVSAFLQNHVSGNEYVWSILLSQVISNVPASIVLYPFSSNVRALLFGLDSAGLCSLIGSLASVINYRIYVREYPGKGLKFIKVFTAVSLLFFAFVALPGYFISR